MGISLSFRLAKLRQKFRTIERQACLWESSLNARDQFYLVKRFVKVANGSGVEGPFPGFRIAVRRDKYDWQVIAVPL